MKLTHLPKPLVSLVARRYIAGASLPHAIAKVKFLNAMGAMATIDLLGEAVHDIQQVETTVATYMQVLSAIEQQKLNTTISIKPSNFGYLVNPELCYQSMERIVKCAVECGTSVCIDMEDHTLTSFTFDAYSKLRVQYPQQISTVMQAYLKRSMDDALRLTSQGATNLRLCKGIYIEPEEIAYKGRSQVQENYLKLLDFLFSKGAYVGIATHDNPLVSGAVQLIEKYHLDKKQYEFQMLLGVRPELLHRIIELGHPIRVYVPFGQDWYAYSMRRLKENPSIAGNIIKSFLPSFLRCENLPV